MRIYPQRDDFICVDLICVFIITVQLLSPCPNLFFQTPLSAICCVFLQDNNIYDSLCRNIILDSESIIKSIKIPDD